MHWGRFIFIAWGIGSGTCAFVFMVMVAEKDKDLKIVREQRGQIVYFISVSLVCLLWPLILLSDLVDKFKDKP